MIFININTIFPCDEATFDNMLCNICYVKFAKKVNHKYGS